MEVTDKKQSIVRAENTLRVLALVDVLTSLSLLLLVLTTHNTEENWYFLQSFHVVTGISAFFLSWSRQRNHFVFALVLYILSFLADLTGTVVRALWNYDCVFQKTGSTCMKYLFANLVGFFLLSLLTVVSAVYVLMSARLLTSFKKAKTKKI